MRQIRTPRQLGQPDPTPAPRPPDLPSSLKPILAHAGGIALGEESDDAWAEWQARVEAGHFKQSTEDPQ